MSLRPLPTLRQELTRAQLRVTSFAVVFTALTVLVAGFTTIGMYARTNLRLIAQTASYSVAPAIVFNDPVAERDSLAPLVTTPGIASIQLVDAGGRSLALLRNPRANQAGAIATMSERLFFATPESAPVLHQGRRIGTVHVRGDGQVVATYVFSALTGAALCFLLALAGSLVLARRLQLHIIGPLRSIAEVAHAVRRDRAFDQRAAPASIDEVEGLRTDFNALIGELEAWESSLRNENALLAHQAMHDQLTGLANRAQFELRCAELLHHCQGKQECFAVVFADGDGFKSINDLHGHAAGDAVLKEIARRLRVALRSTDLVARIGGDEFAMLLGPPFDPESIPHIEGMIDGVMREPIALPSGQLVHASLSVGVAVFPDHGGDLHALMHRADTGMYATKPAARRTRRKEAKEVG
jgi:diguanylate cyclase (GGDEF)-like protein